VEINRQAKDLRGMRFSSLVVKDLVHVDGPTGKHAHWLCDCDCGKQRVTRGTDLVRGKKTACVDCTRAATIAKKVLVGGKVPGIYVISSNCEQLFYIGQTMNLRRREGEHRYVLKNGVDRGRLANPRLTESLKKHGPDSFEFSIVEYCDRDLLMEREYHWIEVYREKYPGCVANWHGPSNIANKGLPRTAEDLRKIAEGQRKSKLLREQRLFLGGSSE
jgi:hypothetical protein